MALGFGQALSTSGRLRIFKAPLLESKATSTYLGWHGKSDRIQPGRGRRSSHPHSRDPGCAVAWTAQRLGALQRREGYLERARHRGPPDLRRAHRLDAAGANHSGEWRGAAV